MPSLESLEEDPRAVGKSKFKDYEKKRDFRKTPEPKPGKKGSRGKKPIFVIQKHDAGSLHYDFRLEVDGVLASWAVPKGPSTDPREKRLAIRTEDHPLEYASFEGNIPEEEYGGGTVMVWDRGTYDDITKDADDEPSSISKGLKRGHVAVRLHGKKLKGGYALTQTKMRGDPKNWLLVKMRDDEADARRNPTGTGPDSVKTGRSLEEIAEQEPETSPRAP